MGIDEIEIPDKIYNEIKDISIKLWGTHDNTYGYVTEKLDIINPLNNSPRNVVKIIIMFDHWHQKAISQRISDDAKRVISTCIKAGWPKQIIGLSLEQNAFFKV